MRRPTLKVEVASIVRKLVVRREENRLLSYAIFCEQSARLSFAILLRKEAREPRALGLFRQVFKKAAAHGT